MSATSPLIAEELGRQAPFRPRGAPNGAPGPLGRGHGRDPDLGRRVERGTDPARHRPGAGLATAAGGYIRALQWSLLPFLLYLVLRSFLAALERPGWPLLISLLALPVNLGAA